MTDQERTTSDLPMPPLDRDAEHASTKHGHGRHSWMMIICCLPMLVVAIVLVATGVVTATFLLAAVACMAMMALMMRRMSHGDNEN